MVKELGSLSIYFSSMANGDDKNQQLVIMNLIDDPVVFYSFMRHGSRAAGKPSRASDCSHFS